MILMLHDVGAMATRTTYSAVFVCLVGVMVAGAAAKSDTPLAKLKGGYWPSGSIRVPASSIDATLFTHLFYAFAEIENSTSLLKPEPKDGGGIKLFSASVKAVNPDVKTLISISASGDDMEQVMQNDESRQAFITSSIALARSNGFDGLDLDYEFPQSQAEMDSFSSFLSEWRQAVDAESNSSPLLLTAAVYFKPVLQWVGKGAYPIDSVKQNLDFVNVMCYDFHGSWDVTATGANANLYDPHSELSADYGITSWLEAGLPPEKAALGLTLYGRSWVLKNQSEAAGLNAPAVAAGPEQNISHSKGVFFYAEVKTFIQENNATVVHDTEAVTAYCYANNVWVTYEDPVIITAKVNYTISKNLGGYFFWAITQDSDWEVSRTASQTMDLAPSALSPTEAPAPQSSAFRIYTPRFYIRLVTLVVIFSIILLPFTGCNQMYSF